MERDDVVDVNEVTVVDEECDESRRGFKLDAKSGVIGAGIVLAGLGLFKAGRAIKQKFGKGKIIKQKFGKGKVEEETTEPEDEEEDPDTEEATDEEDEASEETK